MRCWHKITADSVRGKSCAIRALVNTPAVANLIREGKTHQLPGVMQTGQQAGMLTLRKVFNSVWQRVCYKRCFNIQFSYLSVVIVMFY